MKIVVFGGSGRIGSKVVELLQSEGHEVASASPQTGVDLVTGQGVRDILVGADVAVDVTNAMIFDEEEVVAFFTTTSKHLLEAEAAEGVGHHVVLSIVGTDRVKATGYLAGKVAQERTVRSGGIPFTIVRATQFQEFLPAMADSATVDGVVRVPDTLLQPVQAEEVARVVAEVAVGGSEPDVVEVAGPQRAPMVDFMRHVLAADPGGRVAVVDQDATYFGVPVAADGLVPVGDALIRGKAVAMPEDS